MSNRSRFSFPIQLAEGPTQQPSQYGQFTFDGLYVYHTAVADGFQLLGRISTNSQPHQYYYYYGSSSYTRGIFIGDSVYAVSDTVVTAAPTADPSQVQSSVTLE